MLSRSLIRTLFSFVLVALLLFVSTDAFAAYTPGTIYVERFTDRGRRCEWLRYRDAGVGTSDNATVTLDFTNGSIIMIEQKLVSGAGATLHTVVLRASGASATSMDHITTANATAAFIHEGGSATFHLSVSSPKIYVAPGVDSGSNNVVDTELIVCEGVL